MAVALCLVAFGAGGLLGYTEGARETREKAGRLVRFLKRKVELQRAVAAGSGISSKAAPIADAAGEETESGEISGHAYLRRT